MSLLQKLGKTSWTYSIPDDDVVYLRHAGGRGNRVRVLRGARQYRPRFFFYIALLLFIIFLWLEMYMRIAQFCNFEPMLIG